MQTLKTRDLIALGFMTFALFLGAGNIIFPPMVGQGAGEHAAAAATGFLLTGVGLPLLTVVALARVGGGSNPLVVREAPTQEDIDAFAGTGIDPVGRVTAINDRFINLQPQTAGGLDFGVDWSLRRTRFGSFSVNLNATRLLDFTRDPGDIVNALYGRRLQRI